MSGEKPFVLCLTGSLGMGKSRTASFFAEAGAPVHDSDAAVHALYEGEAVPLIERFSPAGDIEREADGCDSRCRHSTSVRRAHAPVG